MAEEENDYRKSLAAARLHGETPYVSSQDTELLRNSVKNYAGERALEIGFGNGSVTEELTKRFELVAGTDLLLLPPQGPPTPAGTSWHIVIADRATCFRNSSFDLVVFNPPYLPSDSIVDITVDGGGGGTAVPLLFLNEALRVLRQDGKVLLVMSSSGEIERIEDYCRIQGLEFEIVARKDMFYETLYVYEMREKKK